MRSVGEALFSGETMSVTMAILGAGYSGKLLALNLVQTLPLTTKIIIIDETHLNGIAYGTPDRKHLLNVRAKDMSAFEEAPNHFVEYLQEKYGNENWKPRFLPRQIYGEYLDTIFLREEKTSRIEKISKKAIKASIENKKIKIDFIDQCILVDHLVLAYGNIHSTFVPTANGPLSASSAWPLKEKSLQAKNILFVGTSLTMADLCLTATRINPAVKCFALSRKGLLPHAHEQISAESVETLKIILSEELFFKKASLKITVRFIRSLTQKYHWQEVVDALRPITLKLFKSFSVKEKKRFIRHLSTYWSIHRHRLSPEIFEELQNCIAKNQLEIISGKIIDISSHPEGQTISFKKKGTSEEQSLLVQEIINCTGPANLSQLLPDPFFQSLLETKLISLDVLGIGVSLQSSKEEEILFTDKISALGPPLRGELLECVAIPDIRKQISLLTKAFQKLLSE
jgi:uncharacterized NAD(P)/FAD-binding protein YdhS